MRILFPDREALSRTYEFYEKNDLRFDLRRIYDISQGKEGGFGLTDGQEDTITAAYDHGYYDVPRITTLSELAEEVGTSHQALSERLRRGHKTLVENSLIVGQGGSDEEDG